MTFATCWRATDMPILTSPRQEKGRNPTCESAHQSQHTSEPAWTA